MKTFFKNPTVIASLFSILLFLGFYFLLNDSGRSYSLSCSLAEEKSERNQALKVDTCYYKVISEDAILLNMFTFTLFSTAIYQVLRKKKSPRFLIFAFCALFFWIIAWLVIIKLSQATVLMRMHMSWDDIWSKPWSDISFFFLFSFLDWIDILILSSAGFLLSSAAGFTIGIIVRWSLGKFKIMSRQDEEKQSPF